jgi:electron transport complex protein RnfG
MSDSETTSQAPIPGPDESARQPAAEAATGAGGEESSPPRGGFWRQSALVLVLAVCFGGLLALVESRLRGPIEQNREDETLSAVPALVAGASTGEWVAWGGQRALRALDAGGRQVGWVLPASGSGYADTIRLLIGLTADGSRVTGLYVLEQKETPGLGSKIVSESWRQQFKDLRTDEPVRVVKARPSGNEILAISGATVSSRSVTDIVNESVEAFRAALAAGEVPAASGAQESSDGP